MIVRSLRSTVLFIALTAAMAACATRGGSLPVASGLRASTFANQPRNYLYVAYHLPTHAPFIARFRIVDGIPQTTPDRTYAGYGGRIAVAGNGTLYNIGGFAINAFDNGSLTPTREIAFPALNHCLAGSGNVSATAIAADGAGNLFVAFYGYQNLRPHRKVPCDAVYVFSPTANGKTKPLQVLPFPHASYLNGLAVDGNDNLYVLQQPTRVSEFANAVTDPVPTRVFRQTGQRRFLSIAVDDAGNVFFGKNDYGYNTGRVERYAPSANPNGHPTSTIVFDQNVHILYSMAVAVRRLFLDDDFKSVDVYEARSGGKQSPLFQLDVENVDWVAATP